MVFKVFVVYYYVLILGMLGIGKMIIIFCLVCVLVVSGKFVLFISYIYIVVDNILFKFKEVC